jgi:hypothetical protein
MGQPQKALQMRVQDGVLSRSSASEEQPSYDEIAELAYSYWEARGGDGESPEDGDWFRAERELKAKHAKPGF